MYQIVIPPKTDKQECTSAVERYLYKVMSRSSGMDGVDALSEVLDAVAQAFDNVAAILDNQKGKEFYRGLAQDIRDVF